MHEMDSLEGPTELCSSTTRRQCAFAEEDFTTMPSDETDHGRWKTEINELMAEFVANRS